MRRGRYKSLTGEEKYKKREYTKNRYQNMSEKSKQKLKEISQGVTRLIRATHRKINRTNRKIQEMIEKRRELTHYKTFL